MGCREHDHWNRSMVCVANALSGFLAFLSCRPPPRACAAEGLVLMRPGQKAEASLSRATAPMMHNIEFSNEVYRYLLYVELVVLIRIFFHPCESRISSEILKFCEELPGFLSLSLSFSTV